MLMTYTIYQVRQDRIRKYGFMGYRENIEVNGKVKLINYKMVFKGQIEAPDADNALNLLWIRLNTNLPAGYTGRSMSLSDIVKLEIGGVQQYFYCDSFGWMDITSEIA